MNIRLHGYIAPARGMSAQMQVDAQDGAIRASGGLHNRSRRDAMFGIAKCHCRWRAFRAVSAVVVALPFGVCGCREKGFQPEKVACSLSIAGETIGGGVLVGGIGENGKTNVALVTARHVVTENWRHADIVDVVYRQKDTNGCQCVRRLTGAWDRWRTLLRKDVDCAWIILNDNEFANGVEWDWVDVKYNRNRLDESDANAESAIIANAYSWHEGAFLAPDGITPEYYTGGFMFPNNRTFRRGMPMWLGAVDAGTIMNESGSGVFAVDNSGKNACLLGTTTASAPGLTGYVEITNVFEAVARTLDSDGANVPYLAERRELW